MRSWILWCAIGVHHWWEYVGRGRHCSRCGTWDYSRGAGGRMPWDLVAVLVPAVLGSVAAAVATVLWLRG